MTEAGYRPQIANITIQPYDNSDDETFIVADETYAHYVLVKKPGVYLFQAMNGERTLEELKAYLMHTHRMKLSMEQIQQFLDMGIRNNFLVKESWHPQRATPPTMRLWRLLGRKYILIRAEKLTQWLHGKRAIWLNPVTVSLFLGGLVIAGVYLLFSDRFPSLDGSALRYDSTLFLYVLPLFILQLALHELGHLFACSYFGVQSQGFGVGLLWRFIPMFYTDTARAYLLPNRWHRVIISAAGPLVDMMMFGFYAVLLFVLPRDHALVYLLRNYMPFLLTVILLNLNPFLVRFDGYWILVDALNKPNLYRNALRYIKIRVLSLVGRASKQDTLIVQAQLKKSPYVAIFYAVYFMLAFTATVVFLHLILAMFFSARVV